MSKKRASRSLVEKKNALSVLTPTMELRFELVAGREIFLLAISSEHINMIVLIAALIMGVQDARVVRKVTETEGALSRVSDLLHFTAGQWDRIDVVYPAFVAVNQYRFFVRRKRTSPNRDCVKKLLDGVLLYRSSLGWLLCLLGLRKG
jgi:hypothetical protein